MNTGFKYIVLVAMVLSTITSLADAQEKTTFFTSSKQLSENVMVANASTSFARQLVLNTDKGLVVFNTAWGKEIAAEHHQWVKKTFNKENYYLAVNLTSDLMDVGGNAYYKDAMVVSQEKVFYDLVEKKKNLKRFVNKRKGVFLWKVNGAQDNINKHGKDSKEGRNWLSWRDICQRVADDLNDSYELRLPDISFRDRMIFDLGNMTLKLINFGECDDPGAIWIHIPEEGLLVTGSVLTTLHLSPTLQPNAGGYDVDRWIALAEEFSKPEANIKEIITAHSGNWTVEKLKTRLKYWKQTWKAAKLAVKEGKSFETLLKEENFDEKYGYIKEWRIFKMPHSEENWVLNEHIRTLKTFYGEVMSRK